MDDSFAVFILTHGRADRVTTYHTLEKQGYTGPVFLVVDNEDQEIEEYKTRYGQEVVVFDKLAVSKTFDTGDNFDDRRSVVFARNACFVIARNLGFEYFLELDDDYTSFVYKFTADLKYREQPVRNLDALFEIVLDYYKSIDAISIALAQNGDFIGGKKSTAARKVGTKRKCMNTFFCSVHRPFQFVARVNEDVVTYTVLGNRGKLLLTLMNVAIIQQRTQANKGGMTDLYQNEGTYIKSFYPVLYAPSCVTIGDIGYKHRRIHHHVWWHRAVPCILDEKHRKLEN